MRSYAKLSWKGLCVSFGSSYLILSKNVVKRQEIGYFDIARQKIDYLSRKRMMKIALNLEKKTLKRVHIYGDFSSLKYIHIHCYDVNSR